MRMKRWGSNSHGDRIYITAHRLSYTQFKDLSIAYQVNFDACLVSAELDLISSMFQVLSDPNLRHIYNLNGQRAGGGVEPAGGFQDPDVVLGMMFGGERFRDLVGEISIGKQVCVSSIQGPFQSDRPCRLISLSGKDMKDAMEAEQQEAEEEAAAGPRAVDAKGKPIFTPEEIQKKQQRQKALADKKTEARKVRVEKLSENLINKVSIFAEGAKSENDKAVMTSFKEICRLEAAELLQAIGRTYISKSEYVLSTIAMATKSLC
jgi:hypothetical protein